MFYRIRDILFAIFGLLIFSGVFIVFVPLLALTQQRVFFVQQRTGYRGKPFWLIKFSTLRDILPGEREEDDQRKRLTILGRFLRKFSFDELPQLWNVLKGEMSIVGPRPLIHEYLDLYSTEQRRRFEVRPGITGWAQVNGRNAISFTERFQLDVWYVQNRSILLDLKIIWKTLTKALSGKDVFMNEKTTSAKFDGKN
ncbi:MAG: sugar transferase [Bacteroidetes bacterium]|nr:sugar transferase [Bacteroidota bacterium]MBP6722008.1 sugar transferase [Bacteroidia bacterium]